jgi:uncharacterized protein
MAKGHIPLRTCIGCRNKRPASEMLRFKLVGDSVVPAANKDSLPGRGCYICPEVHCVAAALKKGRIARALRKNSVILPSMEELLVGIGYNKR